MGIGELCFARAHLCLLLGNRTQEFRSLFINVGAKGDEVCLLAGVQRFKRGLGTVGAVSTRVASTC